MQHSGMYTNGNDTLHRACWKINYLDRWKLNDVKCINRSNWARALVGIQRKLTFQLNKNMAGPPIIIGLNMITWGFRVDYSHHIISHRIISHVLSQCHLLSTFFETWCCSRVCLNNRVFFKSQQFSHQWSAIYSHWNRHFGV